MDEVSSHVRLDLPFIQRQGRLKDCSTPSSDPMMEGPLCRVRREARARERHRRCSVDSLKVLDPNRPIREADVKFAVKALRRTQLKSAAPRSIGYKKVADAEQWHRKCTIRVSERSYSLWGRPVMGRRASGN